MMRYLKYYSSPVAFTALSFSVYLGGAYLWLPVLIGTAALIVVDQVFPKDLNEDKFNYPFLLDLALYLSLPSVVLIIYNLLWVAGGGVNDPLGFAAFFQSLTGYDALVAQQATHWYDIALMTLFYGIPLAGASLLAGHELTHRTWRRFDLWVGKLAMAFSWGIAYPIEHVYGHHSYVGTTKDPATAARGDSLYQHLPKALKRTVVNAWEIEVNRLRKLDCSPFSMRNSMLRLALVPLATTIFAYYMAGLAGVVVYYGLCLIGKTALEMTNYIEHYGIVRVPSEPVQPRHSWNCNNQISNMITFNITRHSHHHAHAQVPFQDLKAFDNQPEMPGGLITALHACLIPPLWRKMIAPKLQEWDRIHASAAEKSLLDDANKNSGWPELLNTEALELATTSAT